MKSSKIFQFNTESCILKARQVFEEMAQIGGSEVMRDESKRALEQIRPNIDAKGLYEVYDNYVLKDEYLTVRDNKGRKHILLCKAFAQIDPASIEGVCVFALTAGNCQYEGERIMAQLFADYWGTAIAETVKRQLFSALKMELAMQFDKELTLSESFGPGLYGMGLAQMQEFSSLCDFTKLDMTESESGYLIPEKSVVGMVFIVNEGYSRLDDKCESCEGNIASCNLCTIRDE